MYHYMNTYTQMTLFLVRGGGAQQQQQQQQQLDVLAKCMVMENGPLPGAYGLISADGADTARSMMLTPTR